MGTSLLWALGTQTLTPMRAVGGALAPTFPLSFQQPCQGGVGVEGLPWVVQPLLCPQRLAAWRGSCTGPGGSAGSWPGPWVLFAHLGFLCDARPASPPVRVGVRVPLGSGYSEQQSGMVWWCLYCKAEEVNRWIKGLRDAQLSSMERIWFCRS